MKPAFRTKQRIAEGCYPRALCRCMKIHVVDTFQQLHLEVLEHPPYNFDLASSDYHLLSSLKEVLRERRFTSDEEMKTVMHSYGSCDFFLFPKLKLPLRGRRFESIEAIKQNSQKELKALPFSAFKKCFEDWEKRWRMCIVSDGAYFEGDKINLDD
ncbi:Mariner Mos1 transposase [Anthophora plagiata]